NDALVKRFLPGVDALGSVLKFGPQCRPSTIIGVVANSTDRPRITPRPFAYFPYNYQPTQLTFTVRTVGNPVALEPPMRRIVAGLGVRVFDPVTTGTDYRDRTMYQERLFSSVLSAFGALATLIACVGIYGMSVYMITRRIPEIGIRMSLGAQRADV